MKTIKPLVERERKLTFEQRKQIVEMHFEKGISQQEIANKFGISRRMVWVYCQKSGQKNPRWLNLDEKEIVQLNTVGQMSIQRIAKQFGVGQKSISKILQKNGISWKPAFRREHFIATVPDYRIKLRIWEYKVLDADNVRCAWCKTKWLKDNRLEAHHIVPIRKMEDDSLLFSIENGITLCRKCHMKVHYRENEFENFFKDLIKSRGCL